MKTMKIITGTAALLSAQLLALPAQAATYVVSGTFASHTGPFYTLLSGGGLSGWFEMPDGSFPYPAGRSDFHDNPYHFDLFDKAGAKVATVRNNPADPYSYGYITSTDGELLLHFAGGAELFVTLRTVLDFDGNVALTGTSTARAGTGSDTFAYFQSGAITVVPEPASWMMMIAGFGLAGYGLRRRERMRAQA